MGAIQQLVGEAVDFLDNYARVDVWQNFVTGIGTQRDKRTATRFVPHVSLGYGELSNLYRFEPIAARICELPPKEMTREWVYFPSDEKGAFQRRVSSLGIRDHVYMGLLWSRTFGAGANVLGLRDGRAPENPVNFDELESIEYITTLDSSKIRVQEMQTDPFQPGYGKPRLYEVVTQSGNRTVHADRVIAYEAIPLPPLDQGIGYEWGDSVLQRCADGIRDFNASHHSAAVIMSDFSQAVIKIKNLSNMLGASKDGNVLKRLQLMDFCRSVLRAIPLDADKEDFARVSTPTSGLPDLLDRIGVFLSTITGIPYTLLLGESPNGLGATGESDHRNFYNVIRGEQEWMLRPKLEYFFFLVSQCRKYRLVSVAKEGIVPFGYKPLWTPSDKEVAATRLDVAKADDLNYKNKAITSKEIASHYQDGNFSIDIKLDPKVERPDEIIEDPDPLELAEATAKAKQLPPGPGKGGTSAPRQGSGESTVPSGPA